MFKKNNSKKSNEEKFLGEYISGRVAAPMTRDYRTKYIWLLAPLIAAGIAWGTGFRPPVNIEQQYEPKQVEFPKKKILGYDKEFFSYINISQEGKNTITFNPNTAVKKFDGVEYVERSRQIDQIYFYNENSGGLELDLHLPSKPSAIHIGDVDFSSRAREIIDGYTVHIEITDELLYNKKNNDLNTSGTFTGSLLELIIYYENANSKDIAKDPTTHKEDAERYSILLQK